MTEFALSFIIFITLIFAIIDFSWIGFQTIAFDYAYKVSSWELFLPDEDVHGTYVFQGPTYDKKLKAQIKISSAGLKMDKVEVKNTKITIYSKTLIVTKPDGVRRVEYKQYMDINSDIKYTIVPLTPFGRALFKDNIVINKKLEKKRFYRYEG